MSWIEDISYEYRKDEYLYIDVPGMYAERRIHLILRTSNHCFINYASYIPILLAGARARVLSAVRRPVHHKYYIPANHNG